MSVIIQFVVQSIFAFQESYAQCVLSTDGTSSFAMMLYERPEEVRSSVLAGFLNFNLDDRHSFTAIHVGSSWESFRIDGQ